MKQKMNANADLRENNKHKNSYVSEQEWSQVFDAETALMRGTIFPELLKPFQYNDKFNENRY